MLRTCGAVVELAGSTAKRVSDKRVAHEVCDEPWLVFDREKHGRDPRIKLERHRPQRLRHRRPKPCFVAGVKLLDFAIVQSVDLICGEFPTDHQSVLPGLASRAMAASRSRCFCTRSSSCGASGVAAGVAAGGAPSARRAPAPCGSATDISSSISSLQSISPITSRRARLIWSATRRRHCTISQATKTSSTKCVPSTATSSPSVTGSIATQLYKQQADLFSTEAWRVFSRLAAAAPTPTVLESVSRRSPAGSLQSCRDPCSGRVRPSASARASPSGLSCISG